MTYEVILLSVAICIETNEDSLQIKINNINYVTIQYSCQCLKMLSANSY